MSEKLSCSYVTYIGSSADKVWHALTDAEITAAWWDRSNVSDWQVGSTWEHRKVDGSGEVDGTGTVLESVPGQRLSMTFPTGVPSKVTFDIEPYHEIVKLTLTHEDLADENLRAIVASVWAAILSNLKTLLEGGQVLPQSPLAMLQGG